MRIGWRNVMASKEKPKLLPRMVYDVGGKSREIKFGRGFPTQRLLSFQYRLQSIADYIRRGGELSNEIVKEISEDLGKLESWTRGKQQLSMGTLDIGQERPLGQYPETANLTTKPSIASKEKIVRLEKRFYDDLKVLDKALDRTLPTSDITSELEHLINRKNTKAGFKRLTVTDTPEDTLKKARVSIKRVLDPTTQIFEDAPKGFKVTPHPTKKGITERKPLREIKKDWSPLTAYAGEEALSGKSRSQKIVRQANIAGFNKDFPREEGTTETGKKRKPFRHPIYHDIPLKREWDATTNKYVIRPKGPLPEGYKYKKSKPSKLPEPTPPVKVKPPTRELTRTVQIPHPLLPGKTMGTKKVVGELPATLARPNLFESAPSQSIIKTEAERTASMGESLEKRHKELGKKLKAMGIKPKGTSAKLLPIMLSLGLLGMMGQE